MKTFIEPRITLVGAGPGDQELITVKGLNALKKADVVLYDALVNEDLLNFAPLARQIYVGKRKGSKAYSQDEINSLLVETALQHGHAVRLKGGDPFVFGRGMEEIEFARSFGIDVDIVPGISSSIAVPGLAGIPVTHRGQSNSFFVVSATVETGELNPELERGLQTSATIIILMGLSKLQEIVHLFSGHGKENTPAAIVLNGSLPDEEILVGSVANLEGLYASVTTKGPGVIVIGEVVSHIGKKNVAATVVNEFALVR